MASTASKRRPAARKPPGLAEEERPFIHDEIIRGVDARRVKDLIEREVLSAKDVFRAIPERTFNRRLAKRETLKPSESDAISRLLRITETAKKLLGDEQFAREWLNLPNPVLRGLIPIELAQTDAGARQVEAALLHLAHGDYL
jgi:putative toxin-antitoxin system antitoxin component (TIGR02293 family)